MKILYLILISTLLTVPATLQAQYRAGDQEKTVRTDSNGSPSIPTARAVRAEDPDQLTLDGLLDEAIWSMAPVATGFTQRTPDDGTPASEKTEAKVIYTDNAIYVGIRAWDSAIDSAAATLFRRDGSAYSDWVYVNIDSYNDNRTGFSFAVNPRGVRKDVLLYNDNSEDLRWDAVWEAETTIDDRGWTVEMKIPLSQLRFNANNTVQDWGINFQRRLARNEEIAFWAPTPQDASGLVSRFGELQGVRDLDKPNNLEITPYLSGSLTRAPDQAGNPYFSRNALTGSAGADLKYGVTSDFTLTATVNPDFGQVEADPAVINLSAFETFFPEQRPFFLEGSDLFQFGHTRTFNRYGNPIVFYSRRIGRRPQGSPGAAGRNAPWTDAPEQTTIASAAKFSGKTENGLSVGVLNAFTLRENALYRTPANEEHSLSVEPPTNYMVSRLKQDFNSGNSYIGGYASAVNRFIGAEYMEGFLHDEAYIGGLDFEHSWNRGEWIMSGVASGSYVSGSPEALQRTQQSSARYYNRVDADHLSVDPNRTGLGGLATEFSFARFGGEHWRGSFTHSMVTPGYEVNDMGFETRADYNAISYLVQYLENDPESELFRSWNIGAYSNQTWNFGGDRIYNGYNLMSNMQFSNLWRFSINAGYQGPQFNDRLLRGGPIAARPTARFASAVVQSNSTRKISFALGHLRRDDQAGGSERDVFLDMTIRPTSYIQFTISPNYNIQSRRDQFVSRIEDPLATGTYGNRYVLSDIDQTALSAGIRLDWTFTPDISLQAYARPFITSGDFSRYKEFRTPGEFQFDVYGEDKGTISEDSGIYTVDPDAGGPAPSFSFPEQDFNFRSVQTNAVFRWEYTPGATLYLVWQQDRSAITRQSDFQVGRDLEGLFSAKPTNVFLVKLNYWLGS